MSKKKKSEATTLHHRLKISQHTVKAFKSFVSFFIYFFFLVFVLLDFCNSYMKLYLVVAALAVAKISLSTAIVPVVTAMRQAQAEHSIVYRGFAANFLNAQSSILRYVIVKVVSDMAGGGMVICDPRQQLLAYIRVYWKTTYFSKATYSGF